MTECSLSAPLNDNPLPAYIGRFAPSPTGPLHLGSLYAAIASWLHAKQQAGKWLLRIEDIDPPREQAGASALILETLANWGLCSDAPVLYQSQRLDAYENCLQTLLNHGQAYRCDCSRKKVAAQGEASPEGWRYNGHCRTLAVTADKQHSIRLRIPNQLVQFADELQGLQTENPEQLYGDFPIRRADGLIAYQLAVVLDDHYQQVSHVVCGIDLMSSTSRQICLQQQLGFSTPSYCHFPVLVADDGQKLSKQNLAAAVPSHYDAELMKWLLSALGLDPTNAPLTGGPEAALQWALSRWQSTALNGRQSLSIPAFIAS